jgi:hypothetical protein
MKYASTLVALPNAIANSNQPIGFLARRVTIRTPSAPTMIAFAIHGACDVYGESIAFQSTTSSTRLAMTHTREMMPRLHANRVALR